jgi:predicted nucleotide-binding protein
VGVPPPANQSDFIASLGMNDVLWATIARSAHEFEETGDWVSFDTLAYEAAEHDAPFDLNEIFKLPSVIGGYWNEEKVGLSGLGLLVAGTAPRTSQTMTNLARICAERKMKLRGDAKIGREVLVTEYGFTEEEALRSQQLVSMLPGISGGGSLGDDWNLIIHRTALEYREVNSPEVLQAILERQAADRMMAHRQALAVAPSFAEGGMFDNVFAAVFVVHGRDLEAKNALWAFLKAIGLHPLDWEEDLVALTGQGTPYVGQVLDAAFRHAQAVVVLVTPDDIVKLHPDLIEVGEDPFELEMTGQPRPNVLLEAGMALGFNPTRTILVEIGRRRPISDLGGRHTIRLATESTLRGLARRLEAAGCSVDRTIDASWSNPDRFSKLGAHSRQSAEP